MVEGRVMHAGPARVAPFDPRRSLRRMRTAVAFVLLLDCAARLSAAEAADLHEFWDNRCASCHRHAGEFARNHLKIRDGRLVGRKPDRDVCSFLVEHGAGAERADGVCRMLTAQAATPSIFKERCASCHDTAAELARTGLVSGEDGTLRTKTGDRELQELLASHGKLAPGEAESLGRTLRRVFSEVDGTAR